MLLRRRPRTSGSGRKETKMDSSITIEIEGVIYVVQRTFDGSPAIFHNQNVKTEPEDHSAYFPSAGHIDNRRPRADDQLVILCRVKNV
jgi:hypothetical protein